MFQVPGPSTAACTGGFTVGPTNATPSPVAPGGTETIETRVCSGGPASDVIVDLEVYNGGGQQVAQHVVGGQSFAAGEARSYSWPHVVPATLPAGTYRITVGVFSADWGTLHTWDNQAATFVVQ